MSLGFPKYRSTHDPDDPDGDPSTEDFESEYYGEFVVRAAEYPESDPDEGEWKYLAVVFEPHGIFLREWDKDAVTELASVTTDVEHEQDAWYQARVEFGGTDGNTVKVYAGPDGEAFDVALEGTTTLEEDGRRGFGMGAAASWHFDQVAIHSPVVGADYGPQIRYFYDSVGRLVKRVEHPDSASPYTVYYYYDGDRLIEEVDESGAVVASYVYGLYIDEVLQMKRDVDDDGTLEAFTYLHDDMSNVVGLLDELGNVLERYEYGDFGMPAFYDGAGAQLMDGADPATQSLVENPFLFNGRRWEAKAQLYDYRTRFMDPQMGRFVRRDTIGLWGDPSNLGNPYGYCGNNPWSRMDPYGEGWIEDGFCWFFDKVGTPFQGCYWDDSSDARLKKAYGGIMPDIGASISGEEECLAGEARGRDDDDPALTHARIIFGRHADAVLSGVSDRKAPALGPRVVVGSGFGEAAQFAVEEVEDVAVTSLAVSTMVLPSGAVLVTVDGLWFLADSADGNIDPVNAVLVVVGNVSRLKGLSKGDEAGAIGKGNLRTGADDGTDVYFKGRQSVGAAAAASRTGLKGLLKDAGLPTSGRVRFVPEKNAAATGLRVSEGGFVDKFGNIWRRPRGQLVGEMHWDVQLSRTGREHFGWASRSGSHLNVTRDGRIAH